MKYLTSHISYFSCLSFSDLFEKLYFQKKNGPRNCLNLIIFSLMIHCQEIWFFWYGRDGHQPYSMGLYAHYKDSLLKVG